MRIMEIQVKSKRIRMLVGGEEPYLLGQDVADLFEYKNHINIIDSLCKNVKRVRDFNLKLKDIDKGSRLIPEHDTYRLAENSNLSNSEELFRVLLQNISIVMNNAEYINNKTILEMPLDFIIKETIDMIEKCSKELENLIAYNAFNYLNPAQVMHTYCLKSINTQLIAHSTRLINIRNKSIKYIE